MATAPYELTVIESIDSTNNYAMAAVHAGLAKHGAAVCALKQTQGKGQRGKKWLTGNGQNIALSITIEPKGLQPDQQFYLSMATALGCYDFFYSYAGDESAIKWPNDIYWRDRKAGGVLIENVIGKKPGVNPYHSWRFAVIGVGINVNQTLFDKELKNAVSIKQITGKQHDVILMNRALHLSIMKRIDALLQYGCAGVVEAYNRHLFKRNNYVLLRKGNIEFETRINGVTPDGRLYTTDRVDNFFEFGEVEWVL